MALVIQAPVLLQAERTCVCNQLDLEESGRSFNVSITNENKTPEQCPGVP